MKNFKRIASVVMVLMMMLSMMLPAMAQTVGTVADNTGSITISNAAKGETYSVYKLFNASVTGIEGGSIAYTGTIPDSLASYFTQDDAGNIFLADNVDEETLFEALKTWAENANATASAVSDGSELVFEGLDYGYYVVTTTQGNTAITVTSTNPDATIVDKNSTATQLSKSVDDADVYIGQTVTYTATFTTSNYYGKGEAAKKVISYTIVDTLPDFLSNVTVTGITVGGTAIATQQFTDGEMVIDWYDDENEQFLYANRAVVEITYTAVVTDLADIDGEGNTNTVIVHPDLDNGKSGTPMQNSKTIFTYAIALKKVAQNGIPLEGAEFQFPFYVKEEADTDGAYIYAGTTEGEGLVNKLTTPTDGLIIVKGVATGDYFITEVTAPLGYNKLTEPVKVTAVKTGSTTTLTTTYLDEDGNVVSESVEGGSTVDVEIKDLAATSVVVVNKTGTELPSTGGIGTTIFYCAGAILAVGAFVLLITKKRMGKEV